jgi:hypothetical protein
VYEVGYVGLWLFCSLVFGFSLFVMLVAGFEEARQGSHMTGKW